ncbi:DNA-directed RNA polymerases III, 39 kDa polypeptide, putative [Eimeria tenella]|uniref:DNA-directed RNA polymerase III subunit RPC6 n=1 Tax=Eimeria tenella TaxID=5802 RepID=U6L5J5_EIMTE|nr:DNA-directed RNA polymerases III, 39 kDa polypeptide, putative [Eimeria tenella]CDJ43060.1 DNA-directed RNA polymerases III, 39 kDa polypeptide, putative [Eimeria tenella]|eukprot:XP_013233810.1 DNA-directed RNA polymerases III, 39 kDa polypeptide, putative [Eimeria tenella]
MSAPKEGSATGEPKDEGARATAETPRGAPAGAPRGSSALSGEDLSTAYNLGLRNNNELTQQLLLDQGWPREKIVAVFNRLNEARAGVIRKKGDNICCVVRPANVIPALKQLDALDYKVYCAVELAGNTGVWTADIRKSTGLQTHIIQRGVKNLCENLQLIKPVKSIHVKNRKMYILSHMEPAKEIAGGSFYTNGEFNEQLVEQLRDRLAVFLCNARSSTFSSLVAFVRSSGDVAGSAFTDEDISQLVATLECEDKVARIRTGTETTFVWNQSENLHLLDTVPCIGCPLVGDCSAHGKVNPRDCTYLSHWLGLDVDVDVRGEGEQGI